MKTIPNLSFEVRLGIDANPTTTATFIKLVLSQAPQGGFDFATMRARNRVAELLEKLAPNEEIKLEDSDFSTVVQCAREFRWASAHKDVLKFAEQFGL